MDDNSGLSGIERAAQQGVDAFEGEQFSSPVPPPIGPPIPPGIPGIPPNGLFTRPHFMEGAFYVSADRMSWWNGMMWVPGRPPGSTKSDDASAPGSPIFPSPAAPPALFLVALAVMAVIGYIAWSAFQSMQTLGPGPPLP